MPVPRRALVKPSFSRLQLEHKVLQLLRDFRQSKASGFNVASAVLCYRTLYKLHSQVRSTRWCCCQPCYDRQELCKLVLNHNPLSMHPVSHHLHIMVCRCLAPGTPDGEGCILAAVAVALGLLRVLAAGAGAGACGQHGSSTR